MKDKIFTRKKFLTDSSKVALGGVAGIAALSLLANDKLYAENNSSNAQWPFPYTALDPEEARLNAHHLYWNGMDCCTGVYGGIAQLLERSLGSPWSNVPIEIMLFGRAGGAGWGSLCGTLNGAAAIISLVVTKDESVPLINEIWGYYTTENLPTQDANEATYVDQNFQGEIPSNISGSILCHASVAQWCYAAGKKMSDVDRKERCGRLAGDIAAKTVEVLNAYFNLTFTSTFHDTETVESCMTCHAIHTKTHMECVDCHSDAHFQITAVPKLSTIATLYKLDDAYPNPFRNSTRIQFTIPSNEKVRLEIYDLRGSLVKSLIDSEVSIAGTHSIDWSGDDNSGSKVAAGIYLAKLTTANFMKTIKISCAR